MKVDVNVNGTKRYYNKEGEYHREDGPAIEYTDGHKEWYQNGKLHRLDGPAIEWYGNKRWYINGERHTEEEYNKKFNLVPDNTMKVDTDGTKTYRNKAGQLHREDGPAYEQPNGYKAWYINDKLHRIDGPAIEGHNGNKHWYINGQLHRLDGPAVEWPSGHKEWFVDGKKHREDGPAIEYANGAKKWYIDGKKYTEEEYNKKLNLVSDNIMNVDQYGNKTYRYKNGILHRENGPAIEWANGSKSWYIHGQLHRIDGPAIEQSDGHKAWYINGELHREDGPAIEWPNGSKYWYINDQLHREDGPAIEYTNGDKYWFIDGKKYTADEYNKKINLVSDNTMKIDADGNKTYLNKEGQYHREDGPAIEWPNGYKSWWINGKRHRVDGPAIECANGHKEWYINGKEYTEEKYNDYINPIKKNNITPEKTMLQTVYAHPTVVVGINALDNATKLTAARQVSRLLAKFVASIAKAMLIKLGYKEYIPLLETDLGKALLEISAPTLMHMAVNHGIIPENKYNTYIETVSKLSLDANIAFYAMKYSDQALDVFTALATDPKTRENVGAIVKLGMALNQSDKGSPSMLEGLVMPSFGDLDNLVKDETLAAIIR